jgi:hypothetical protein
LPRHWLDKARSLINVRARPWLRSAFFRAISLAKNHETSLRIRPLSGRIRFTNSATVANLVGGSTVFTNNGASVGVLSGDATSFFNTSNAGSGTFINNGASFAGGGGGFTRKRLAAVITDLEKQGLRPRIQDAWRSPADQLKAFNSGHSKLKFGFHNVTAKDGTKEALAVDLLDDDHAAHEGREYLLRLAAAAEKQGLTTGIRWGLPQKLRDAIDAAIAAGKWDAPVKIGWDPAHVEPTGITPAQAKAGKRPA